jgi:hypothetical protein
MKWALNILGVLLFLSGTVYILQGTGLLPVGMMAHQMKWAYTGIVLDVIAIGLFIFANRPQKHNPPSA